jgi:hypothetical protein
MKEDVLEQLVDDYLKLQGYFTRHNVKFNPRPEDDGYVTKQDSVPSDIDVIGFHPLKTGPEKVWVVSCKSWQSGFDASWWADNTCSNVKSGNKEAWRHFRELASPKWTKAFLREVRALVGTEQFTYVTCVTRLRGSREKWEQQTAFTSALKGNPVRLLTLKEIVDFVREKTTATPAPSEIGRLVQLLKSAKLI